MTRLFSSRLNQRRLSLETLESRWTPSWAGVPPATITPPASAATAAPNSLWSASGAASNAADEVDYYSFIAPASGKYQILVASSVIDPVVGVFSSAGTRLTYNDDISESNTNSRLSLDLKEGSRYYVGITNYSDSDNGRYTWTIVGPSTIDDGREQNDTLETPHGLGALSGAQTYRQLVMNDAQDWYRFTIRDPGGSADFARINFSHDQGDLNLHLYDSQGTRLGSSRTTNDAERVSLNGQAPGTYYLRVLGTAGARNPRYSLTLDTPDPPPPGVDLRGAALRVADNASWGQTVTARWSVANRGTEPAGDFRTQWWLSRNDTWSSDDVLLRDSKGASGRTLAGLEAGGTSALSTIELVLPGRGQVNWAGNSFYIVMRTDAGNAVSEVNETNNSGQVGLNLDHDPIVVGTPASQFQIDLNISGMTVQQRALFQQAADRWEEVIVGDLPNVNFNGRAIDDLLISARGATIDGPGGILGQAGWDRIRANSMLPYYGSMEFDSADMADMQADGTLLGVIMHEMGHVLGVGTLWDYFGLLRGEGTSSPIFTGAQARAQYNHIFNASAAGVPVENGGGPGTRDSHWRESIFNRELMTGYVEGPGVSMPLSRITVASLADLGYTIDLSAADGFQPSAQSSSTGSSSTSYQSSSSQAALRADSIFAAYDAVLRFGEDEQRKKTPVSLAAE